MTEAQTYSFFLGCVMPNRLPGLEASIRAVLPKLGVHIEDLEGASCCPAPGVVRSFNEPTWLALASRNLALAEMSGHDIITGCNGCYATFKEALAEVREHPARMREIKKIFKGMNLKYKGKVEAKHVIEVIAELGPDLVGNNVTRSLEGLKVGVHYGCHLLKPSKNRPWEQVQRPAFLDELVEATGAASVKYKDKNLCCGAGGGVRGSQVALSYDIAKEKLDILNEAGVDCIVDVCSFCHLQYETAQAQLNKELGEKRYQIPVIYYTQLLGLAMGLKPTELGLDNHVVSTKPLLEKILD